MTSTPLGVVTEHYRWHLTTSQVDIPRMYGLAACTNDDIIERSITHFRQADEDYGKRIAARVKELRRKLVGEDVTIQAGKP